MSKYKIFDVHQHLGTIYTGMAVEESQGTDIDADFAKRSKLMDKWGITCGAIMPILQYLRPRGHEDTKEINNLVARYRDRNPARFPLAFGTVEPLSGEKLGMEEIERGVNELHLAGFVWHHRMQGAMINDRAMLAFLKKIAELKVPALIHVVGDSNFESPWGFEYVVERFPDITFVALDCLTASTRAWDIINIAKRYPNVLLETAGCFPLGRQIDQVVENISSKRVLFGTDLYLSPPNINYSSALEEVLGSFSLSEEDKRNILWNNARRLFNLP